MFSARQPGMSEGGFSPPGAITENELLDNPTMIHSKSGWQARDVIATVSAPFRAQGMRIDRGAMALAEVPVPKPLLQPLAQTLM